MRSVWHGRDNGNRLRCGSSCAVLGIIGFSALFFGLLPSIPWPSITVDIPLPQVPIPQISLPSLPIPDIAVPLPDVTLPRITPPSWLEPLFGVLKYLTPIVIALFVAVREARHRRQRRVETEHEKAREVRIAAPQVE